MMIGKQRPITTYEDVIVDEQTNIGRAVSGAYLEGDAFVQMDAQAVFDRYLQAGLRIPDEFVEVRQILEQRFAVLRG